jgi:putative transposase
VGPLSTPTRSRPGVRRGSGSSHSWPFPPELRRVIYTTNSIESLNYQLRKVTKNRGHFPSNDAVVKLLWLAICTIEHKRARQQKREKGRTKNTRKSLDRLVESQVITHWKQTHAQLTITYPDRINPHPSPQKTKQKNRFLTQKS